MGAALHRALVAVARADGGWPHRRAHGGDATGRGYLSAAGEPVLALRLRHVDGAGVPAHPVRALCRRRDLSLPYRGRGARPVAGAGVTNGRLQADAVSGEDENRLLQGCQSERQLPRHPLRLLGIPVPGSQNDVDDKRKAHLHAWLPACGQSESTRAHRAGNPRLGAALPQRQISERAGRDVQSNYSRLDRLLQPLLSDAVEPDAQADRRLCHSVGPPQVQADGAPDQGSAGLVRPVTPGDTKTLCSLASMPWQRPNIGSRVTREGHARFWERPGVKLPRATRHRFAICRLRDMNFSELFIRRPVATSLLMAAVAFVGIAAFPFLPVASLPQIDFPTIQVTASMAGASAETMAVSVATPLERQLSQIPGITQLTSQSTVGSSQVVIQFDLNRNIDSAAQNVQSAISIAGKTLPLTMTIPPTYRKVNPADPPVLILGGRSETLPLTRINELLDSFLAQQIGQMPGVAQAQIGGDRRPSIRIQVDPARLAALGLTLEEIRPAIVNATTAAPKGMLNTAEVGFTIAANDQILEAEPFNDVILAYRNGGPIRVRDVGQAVADASNRNLAGYQNNELGIILNVSKQPGANVIDTVDQIKARLPRLTANLPPAMTVQTIFDRTEVIRASVHDVEFTLVLTIGIVVLVVLLFLRNFWATIIPGITIPLALLGSLGVMYMLNFSLNNLSLMALTIAIGFVVDDAIVVVENIYRHVEDGSSPMEAALKGSREIAFTVLSISLSLVAAFIPVLLMGGIIGRIFREFALTVTASIAVSVLVSLTLAPMLCSRCMKHAEEHGRFFRAIEAGFDSLLSGYRYSLDFVLRHRAITLGAFFATLALTVVMAVQIPKGFFPLQDTGLITGVSEAAQDVSPERMMRLQRALGEVILSDPDVQGFASQTGNNDNPTTANTGRFSIVLKPL